MDDDEDDMARVAGRFKGTLCLYKLQEGDEGGQEDVTHTHSTLMPKLKLMERLPSFKPHEVLVRIYIVQVGSFEKLLSELPIYVYGRIQGGCPGGQNPPPPFRGPPNLIKR